jgi:hypothetical protein
MQILHLNKKGTNIDTIEQFCIYKEISKNNQLNDKQTV